MKAQRGIFVHLGVLVVAAVFALMVWTQDKQPKALANLDVTVWSGRASDVQKIAYEGKNKKVTLESKKDSVGRYFVGTVDKAAAAPKPGADGGAPTPPPDEDGDDDEHENPTPPPAAADATKRTTTPLLSVGNAEKLAEALAPLKAFRNVGKIGDDRAAEFGLAEPEGSITVTIGGNERKLVIGGPTPGGSDRYIRDASTNEVFAIKGDTIRDLESADSRLVERDLHEWKDPDLHSAKVIAGGKSREIVRGGGEGKKFWADPASKDQNDETVGNWMTKIDRLRPTEYVPTAPEGRETVVRIEYTGPASKGYIEVVKTPGAAGGKPDYYIQTERTRQFAKVTQSFGEQVEQDVGSIVK